MGLKIAMRDGAKNTIYPAKHFLKAPSASQTELLM